MLINMLCFLEMAWLKLGPYTWENSQGLRVLQKVIELGTFEFSGVVEKRSWISMGDKDGQWQLVGDEVITEMLWFIEICQILQYQYK